MCACVRVCVCVCMRGSLLSPASGCFFEHPLENLSLGSRALYDRTVQCCNAVRSGCSRETRSRKGSLLNVLRKSRHRAALLIKVGGDTNARDPPRPVEIGEDVYRLYRVEEMSIYLDHVIQANISTSLDATC